MSTIETKIVAFFNQKGGCGKTMSSMQIGGAFALAGNRVAIFDMDPQGTATFWSGTSDPSEPFPASVIPMGTMVDQFVDRVRSFVGKYHLIVLDCPPAVESDVAWKALLMADFAFIPVIPALDNVWASRRAEELYLAAKEKNNNLQCYYLLSAMQRGAVIDQTVEVLKEQAKVPVLNNAIYLRNVYKECQYIGATVCSPSMRGRGAKAAAEDVGNVCREIAAITGIKYGQGKGK